jgi:uncharacterized protein (TIGR00369 family)
MVTAPAWQPPHVRGAALANLSRMSDSGTPVGAHAAPLDAALRLTRQPDADGWAVLRLDPQPIVFSGDGDDAYIHGGALATCVDTAAWEAVVAIQPGTWVVADMRLDFLRLARPVPHRVRAHARRVGRRQAVADVEISAWDDPSRLVALGRATLTRVS